MWLWSLLWAHLNYKDLHSQTGDVWDRGQGRLRVPGPNTEGSLGCPPAPVRESSEVPAWSRYLSRLQDYETWWIQKKKGSWKWPSLCQMFLWKLTRSPIIAPVTCISHIFKCLSDDIFICNRAAPLCCSLPGVHWPVLASSPESFSSHSLRWEVKYYISLQVITTMQQVRQWLFSLWPQVMETLTSSVVAQPQAGGPCLHHIQKFVGVSEEDKKKVLSWTFLHAGCQSRDTEKALHLSLKNFTNRPGMGREGKDRGIFAAVDTHPFKKYIGF